MDQAAISRINQRFASCFGQQSFGAKLSRVQAGEVEITAPILEGARQQQGFGHAGLAFSLGDSAAGYAALTLLPLEHEVVTAEIKINLLAPAIGTRLIAIGKVIKPGRRLNVVSAEVFAEAEGKRRLIAVLQGTMVPVPADPAAQ